MMLLLTTVILFNSLMAVLNQNCEPHEGYRQSPINIKTAEVISVVLPPLQWSSGYSTLPESMTLKNDGYSLQLSTKTSLPLQIKSPLTSIPYNFTQLHFHWGDGEDNYKGSEHYINGHFYPLEMHAVHKQSVSNATDQFLVIAYLFQLSRQKNQAMERIADAVLDATVNGNSTVDNFKLINLLYNVPFSYFTYEGSLTTPPYTESVAFLVAANPFPVTQHQLEVFQKAAVMYPKFRNNYRCLQKLNHRRVMHVLLSTNNE